MIKRNQTRKWQHPEGYKFLAPWTNAVLLRHLVRKITDTLPKSEYRMKAQADDACRSIVANIEEGYKRPTTKEYLDYLGFSQGSLEEVKGDIRRLHQDGFLHGAVGSSLKDLNIDLKEFKGYLKDDKGNTQLEELYRPLKNIRGKDLTFEMMMELCNKTDYLLRRLVESLEQNITKADSSSPLERWRGEQIELRRQKDEEFDRQLKEILSRKNQNKTVDD